MSTFLQAIGLGLNIFGAIKEGREQSDEASLQADLEESRAIAEGARTADLEAHRRKQAARTVGAQKADYAHAGVRQEGTPLLVLQKTLLDAEEDVLRIKATGEAKTFGFKTQAKRFRDIGRQKKDSVFGKVGSSLITAAGDFIL